MFGLNFNDAVVSHMESLHIFHNAINDVLLVVLAGVLVSLLLTWKFVGFKYILVEWIKLELLWTIFPAVILLCIGIPSIIILYQEFPDYDTPFVFTVMGHQWYWSFVGLDRKEFDSFLEKKEKNSFRNLEVDKCFILPLQKGVRIFVSSADVIHRFSLPALAVKIDAVPGRLKELYIFPLNLGKYFGQCSEICGANHAFMPISLEVLPG